MWAFLRADRWAEHSVGTRGVRSAEYWVARSAWKTAECWAFEWAARKA